MEHTEQITDFAAGLPAEKELRAIANAVEEGHIDALAAFITLTRLSKLIDQMKDRVKESALTEAAKWPEKSFNYFGVTVEKRAAAGRWDFKSIPSWQEAKATVMSIEERAKAAYEMRQKFNAEAVTEDGELIDGAVYTQGADIIAIKGL